jgi:hypothetical protein
MHASCQVMSAKAVRLVAGQFMQLAPTLLESSRSADDAKPALRHASHVALAKMMVILPRPKQVARVCRRHFVWLQAPTRGCDLPKSRLTTSFVAACAY